MGATPTKLISDWWYPEVLECGETYLEDADDQSYEGFIDTLQNATDVADQIDGTDHKPLVYTPLDVPETFLAAQDPSTNPSDSFLTYEALMRDIRENRAAELLHREQESSRRRVRRTKSESELSLLDFEVFLNSIPGFVQSCTCGKCQFGDPKIPMRKRQPRRSQSEPTRMVGKRTSRKSSIRKTPTDAYQRRSCTATTRRSTIRRSSAPIRTPAVRPTPQARPYQMQTPERSPSRVAEPNTLFKPIILHRRIWSTHTSFDEGNKRNPFGMRTPGRTRKPKRVRTKKRPRNF